MPVSFGERIRRMWNAFSSRDPTEVPMATATYSYRPDAPRLSGGNERSIIASVENQIANDVARMTFRHVRVNQNDRFVEEIDSELNKRLRIFANKDESSRQFIQNVVLSMFDEGEVAIVPVDTDTDIDTSGSFKIYSWRVGAIQQWQPDKVQVHVYNDNIGLFEDLWYNKATIAIIENPLRAVMNEPNSTLKRLIYKLNLLDSIDKQSGSGKLDLIIQLPYPVRSEVRKAQAEERRKNIEDQLANSKYGVAYTDATEKIVQLNRAVENNLMTQVEYLTKELYNQLGMSQAIFDGSADEATQLNYQTRTLEPIVGAIVENMTWKFISEMAYAQGQRVKYFSDPFKLVPVSQMADIADKFTRNEILSPNEVRGIIGYRPSDDPAADELRNRNISQAKTGAESPDVSDDKEESIQNGRKSEA